MIMSDKFFTEGVYRRVLLQEPAKTSKLQIRGGIHIIFFLFLCENICCGYSLEGPWAFLMSTLNMFSSRSKKDISIFRMKKAPLLYINYIYFLNYSTPARFLTDTKNMSTVHNCPCIPPHSLTPPQPSIMYSLKLRFSFIQQSYSE